MYLPKNLLIRKSTMPQPFTRTSGRMMINPVSMPHVDRVKPAHPVNAVSVRSVMAAVARREAASVMRSARRAARVKTGRCAKITLR